MATSRPVRQTTRQTQEVGQQAQTPRFWPSQGNLELKTAKLLPDSRNMSDEALRRFQTSSLTFLDLHFSALTADQELQFHLKWGTLRTFKRVL